MPKHRRRLTGLRRPETPLAWLALVGSTVLTVAGLLPGIRTVFGGHITHMLPTLSLLTFLLLFYGLPAGLVVCNAAAFQRGGRRLARCVAITATLLGGLALAWWLARSAPQARTILHGDGRVTFSYADRRLHGLLSWAASLGMFCMSAWILLRRTPQSSDDDASE